MNVRRSSMLAAAVPALLLGLSAVPAKAAPVLKGTFELPAPVYWGSTLLPAGEYTIFMDTEVRDLAHVPVIHVAGEGVTLTLLTIARPTAENGRNVLEISEIGGAHVVSAFDAGTIGESFSFGVNRAVKAKALRAGNETVSTVAVTASAAF